MRLAKLALLCYKVAESLWGSLASCGRLTIGHWIRSGPDQRRLPTAAQDSIPPTSEGSSLV
jgi:hypothetical protein